jgi:spore germination cell wall hydrolase CwlJ-like protein
MNIITGLLVQAVFFAVLLVSFSENIPQSVASVSVIKDVDENELLWMAKAMYFEAGGESLAGKLAIGLVIKNRINDGRYPNTIYETITQSKRNLNGNAILHKCQFNWYCDGKSDEPNYTSAAWAKSLYAARAVLEGRVIDFTDGATHFHNPKVFPNWGYPKMAQIDGHTFYKRN